CNIGPDGTVFCMDKRGHGHLDQKLKYIGRTRNGDWDMYRAADDERNVVHDHLPEPEAEPEIEAEPEPETPNPHLKSQFDVAQKDAVPLDERRERQLSRHLELPLDSDKVADLGVKWLANDTYNRSCFLIPEKNAKGDLINYQRRYADGSKQ